LVRRRALFWEDSRRAVQIEAVIIGAVLGVIINLIRRTISGRRVGG